MQRVERHIITKNKNLEDLTFKSKNLYNFCNYIIRQNFFKTSKILNEYELSTKFAKENQADYRALPAQTSQQVIKLLFKNWKSSFKALKEFKKNPKKFKSSPKLPKYKDKTKGRNIVIFTNQQCRLKEGYIYFIKNCLPPLKTKVNNIKQVRIVPHTSCFIIEVVYEKKIELADLDSNLYLGVDLGINNLATCVNNTGLEPFIVNGKIVKSINQYFNKKKSKLMSFIKDRGISNNINKLTFKRNNKLNDYFHKTSRFIINYCIENKIKTIVIGYNEGWKQEVNIGKRNNQKFVNIPFLKLIQQLEYKGEEVGIEVIIQEESYTSKCDFLALEKIKKHEQYIGNRVKRGLFKSSTGKLINADVNAAFNILRKKVVPRLNLKGIEGVGLHPIIINL